MGDRGIGETADILELPKVQNYYDLLVWQQSIQLVKKIYQLTQAFPREEIYGLTAQIRRAAILLSDKTFKMLRSLQKVLKEKL